MRVSALDRRGLIDGAKTMFPLVLPGVPFGLVLGVAISDAVVNQWLAWSSSWIIFAGSAQFISIELLDEGAGFFVVAISVWVINARHIMYSAALVGRYVGAPQWWRLLTSYVLVDQAFAMAYTQDQKLPLSYRMSYLLGGGFSAWIMWQCWVTLGMLAGGVIPENWSLEFAIPILFLTLMILAITNIAGAVAAVVGGTTAVLASGFPNGTGLLIGALLGVIAGGVTDFILNPTDTKPATTRTKL